MKERLPSPPRAGETGCEPHLGWPGREAKKSRAGAAESFPTLLALTNFVQSSGLRDHAVQSSKHQRPVERHPIIIDHKHSSALSKNDNFISKKEAPCASRSEERGRISFCGLYQCSTKSQSAFAVARSFHEDSPEVVSISYSEASRLSPVLLHCYSRAPLTVFIDACRRGEPVTRKPVVGLEVSSIK
jgi:hypothetical protein